MPILLRIFPFQKQQWSISVSIIFIASYVIDALITMTVDDQWLLFIII
jgi:hypothetical protein